MMMMNNWLHGPEGVQLHHVLESLHRREAAAHADGVAGYDRNHQPQDLFLPLGSLRSSVLLSAKSKSRHAEFKPLALWEIKATSSNLHTRLGFSARPMVASPSANPAAPIDTKGRVSFPFTFVRSATSRFSPTPTTFISQFSSTTRRELTSFMETDQRAGSTSRSSKRTRTAASPSAWSKLDENTAFDWNNNNVFLNDGTWQAGTAGTLKPSAQHAGVWIELDKQ